MMDRNEVLKAVTEIARDVFENRRLKLKEDTTAWEVDGWDSLTYVALLGDIEEEFQIEFTLEEMSGMKNIGELLDSIVRHVNR